MKIKKPSYDAASKESILSHARVLLGASLRQIHPDALEDKAGKGALGQLVEKIHFGYNNNSESRPDFPDAGVELKCTALKELKEGSYVSKDRLVLNVINYLQEATVDFASSSFWKKNRLLLLMFYLHIAGVDSIDLIFKIIRLWSIPKEDLKIFMDDWAIIHDKIVKGVAHELHEGDTLYLAAAPKGSRSGAEMRKQPGTDIRAPQKAYSIKRAYLNQIILESLEHPEMFDGVKMSAKQKQAIVDKSKKQLLDKYGSIVKDAKAYGKGQTFEEYVTNKFQPYMGKSVGEIGAALGVKLPTSSKSISYALCRAILGVKAQKIAEFEKAGVLLKTVRLEENGGLKEAMSFGGIKYNEIVKEENWEDSKWYDILTHRFFLVVFRKKNGGSAKDAILERVFFWAIPFADLNKAEDYWRDIRDKVRQGDYDHFLKATEHDVCHVRPKAKNGDDLASTPQGGFATKYCYWLNRVYVLDVVKKHS